VNINVRLDGNRTQSPLSVFRDRKDSESTRRLNQGECWNMDFIITYGGSCGSDHARTAFGAMFRNGIVLVTSGGRKAYVNEDDLYVSWSSTTSSLSPSQLDIRSNMFESEPALPNWWNEQRWRDALPNEAGADAH
jgi:hypothetical protein